MVSATAFIVDKVGAAFEAKSVELDSLRPNEVLVDLKATGICHTDIAVQQGKIPMKFSAVLGHEGSGVVRAVGSEVRDYREAKQTYQCHTAQKQNFGGIRPDGSQTIISNSEPISTCFFDQSSSCNPAVVQEASCVKIDSGIPLSIICALGCGFQTGAGSIYNVIKPLERNVRHIVIFGIGRVGCAAVMAAHHLVSTSDTSSFEIIAVDVNDSRLELAKELGATHVINPSQRTVREAVMEITKGEGMDASVDCTGSLNVVNEMIGLLGVGGIAVTVGGPPPGTKASVDVFDMLIKCKTYCGCHQGNAYSKEFTPWLAELYAKGQFPLDKMQKTYAAKDINTACKDMLSGVVIKPILLWE